MSTMTVPQQGTPSRRSDEGGWSVGHIFGGVLLVAAGAAWLLDSSGAVSVPWDIAPAIALVAVGVTLMLAALAGRSAGGLIGVGIVLIFVQTAVSAIDVPVRGGVGNRDIRPVALSEVESPYRLAVGNQTIDLRQLALNAQPTYLEASTGVGKLVVIVPRDARIVIDGHTGAGTIQLPGRTHEGSDIDVDEVLAGTDGAGKELRLKLSVGVGEIEVQQ